MASAILYPPIVDGYVPAKTFGQNIYIPFDFSKFNIADADDLIEGKVEGFDPLTVHVVIYEAKSGKSTVNTLYEFNNGAGFDNGYTKNGTVSAKSEVIINLTPVKIKEGLYQIQLVDNLFVGGRPSPGKMYKIQLRFSGKKYTNFDESGASVSEADWLAENANYFSEWSTVCILKYTDIPTIGFTNPIVYNTDRVMNGEFYSDKINWPSENLVCSGDFSNIDKSEYMTGYRIKLFTSNNSLLEDTDLIEVNTYAIGAGSFKKDLKTELEDGKEYILEFSYETNNYFSDSIKFRILATLNTSNCPLIIDTIDFDELKRIKNYTSLGAEQEDARVALFVRKDGDQSTTEGAASYRIKRYSSKDNFKTSENIVVFSLKNEDIGTDIIGPFYDWTIESGVLYKYSIQKIIITKIEPGKSYTSYSRGNKTGIITRVYDFSYLLGKNNQQLKLAFNQQLNSFNITVNDGQYTTLGGKYPFITRNGNTRYRQFPVSGLISFNMDENELFTSYEELFPTEEIRNYYKTYNSNHGINLGNDIVYEKMFRDKVLEFLYNDKPKLFKSPTEGMVIVRILNVSCSPDQTLNKMIYSFSGTAYEVAEPTQENYKKYKFFNQEIDIDSSMIHKQTIDENKNSYSEHLIELKGE